VLTDEPFEIGMNDELAIKGGSHTVDRDIVMRRPDAARRHDDVEATGADTDLLSDYRDFVWNYRNTVERHAHPA
jgi:hypothetical protein